MFSLKHRNAWTAVQLRDWDQLIPAIRAWLLTTHEEDGTLQASAVSVSSLTGLPVGLIVGYGGASAPSGWLLCDGSAVSRVTYKDLFDAIGTTWGVGDGATTFNLPDGRGKALLGKAAAGTGSTLGASFGTLDHTHTLTTGAPSATTVVQSGAGSTVASSTHTHAGPTGATNGPYFVGNYIILVQ
jgi:microcystin-dependent protein